MQITTHQSEIKALALLTDGLQNLCIQNQTGDLWAQFFIPFFDAIKITLDVEKTSEKPTDFINSKRMCSKTDDDKTLVFFGKARSENKVED